MWLAVVRHTSKCLLQSNRSAWGDDCPKEMDWRDTHALSKCLCKGGQGEQCGANVTTYCGHTPRNHSKPVITLFRNTTLRIASGLLYYLHDCARLATAHLCDRHHPEHNPCKILDYIKALDEDADFDSEIVPHSRHQTWGEFILDYAQCVEGCASNMLTGFACGRNTSSREDLIAKSAAAFRRQIVFAGITDRFNDSVALFDAMFGEPFYAKSWRSEAKAAYRVQDSRSLELKIASYLENLMAAGRFQPIDEPLYQLATEWFETKVEEYGITPSTPTL